jgi:hypothetical protein
MMKIRFALLMIVLLLAAPAGVNSSGPAAGQPAASQEASEEELREFVPSEEVKADTAIAFPVDI